MRPFQETITWLRFRTEFRQAPPSFWLLAGDLVAGLRYLRGIPLPAAEARSLERELLAEGVRSRLALDGLSLPLEVVRQHLQPRSAMGPKSMGHEVAACVSSLNTNDEGRPTPEFLQTLHRTITEGSGEDERPGNWRVLPIGGRPWEGVPPEVIGLFTEELCDWLNGADLAAPTSDEDEAYAIIRILIAELYLAWIRPFATGHFRVTGAFGAAILHKSGMGMVAAHMLAIALHRNGREFQRQVQQASEGAADPIPFMAFALRGMTEVLHEWHGRIRDFQVRGQWRAQLLELFQDGNDEPTRRQRQVLLDLAGSTEPVPLSRLDHLSPTLAKLYAGVSEKTLRRDVDALLAAGVVHKTSDGLRVDLTTVLAFKG